MTGGVENCLAIGSPPNFGKKGLRRVEIAHIPFMIPSSNAASEKSGLNFRAL